MRAHPSLLLEIHLHVALHLSWWHILVLLVGVHGDLHLWALKEWLVHVDIEIHADISALWPHLHRVGIHIHLHVHLWLDVHIDLWLDVHINLWLDIHLHIWLRDVDVHADSLCLDWIVHVAGVESDGGGSQNLWGPVIWFLHDSEVFERLSNKLNSHLGFRVLIAASAARQNSCH